MAQVDTIMTLAAYSMSLCESETRLRLKLLYFFRIHHFVANAQSHNTSFYFHSDCPQRLSARLRLVDYISTLA